MVELLILLTAFLVRVFPRLILQNSWSYDTYFHMAVSRIIRQNKYRIPDRKERIFLEDRMDYPWLFHWFFSFIPDKYLNITEKTSSAFIDTVHVAIAMWCVERLLINIDLEGSNIHIWTGIFLAIIPSFLRVGMGPRAYNATPRVLSQFILFIFFISLAFYYQERLIEWLLLALLCSVIINISSIFGFQFIWLISIVLLLFGYSLPLALTVVGLLTSFLIFRKKVLVIISANIKSMLYYYSTLSKNFIGLIEEKGCIRCYFLRMKENFMTSKMLNWFMMDQYPLHIFVFFMPVLWLLLFNYDKVPEELHFVFSIVLGSFVIFALVLFPKFIFIGEAERYLEHTVFFQVFLFVLVWDEKDAAYIYLLLVWFLLCYTQYIRLYIKYNKKMDKLPLSLIPLVKELEKDSNIVYPLGKYCWPLLYYMKKGKICYPATSWDTVIIKEELALLVGNYPYPGVALNVLKEKYGITHVITDEYAYDMYKKLIKESSGDNMKLLKKNGIYMIFKLEE